MNIYPRVPAVGGLRLMQDQPDPPDYISPDGPVGDMARAALEGHPSVMGRFQYQEENVQAIPREQTLEELLELRRSGGLHRPPLRGQTEIAVMIDDDHTEFEAMVNNGRFLPNGDYLPGNLSQQWQRARRLSTSTDKNKATKCIEIAQFLLENYKGQVDEEMIEETAIDLMPLPTMNIERIHKRLGLDTKKTAEHPKLLNRFQILKKEDEHLTL